MDVPFIVCYWFGCPFGGGGGDWCRCCNECGCCAGSQYGKKNLPQEDYAREAEHRRLDREARAEGITLPPYPPQPQMGIPGDGSTGDTLPRYQA